MFCHFCLGFKGLKCNLSLLSFFLICCVCLVEKLWWKSTKFTKKNSFKCLARCIALPVVNTISVLEKLHTKKRNRLATTIFIIDDPQESRLAKFIITLLQVRESTTRRFGLCPLQSPTEWSRLSTPLTWTPFLRKLWNLDWLKGGVWEAYYGGGTFMIRDRGQGGRACAWGKEGFGWPTPVWGKELVHSEDISTEEAYEAASSPAYAQIHTRVSTSGH